MSDQWRLVEFSLRHAKDGHRVWAYVEIERGKSSKEQGIEVATYSSRSYKLAEKAVQASEAWAEIMDVHIGKPDLDHIEVTGAAPAQV